MNFGISARYSPNVGESGFSEVRLVTSASLRALLQIV
jgi:hypothetical protein